MSSVDFLYIWNGIQKRKKLFVSGLKMINRSCWNEEQNPIVTIKYEEETSEARITSLNCSYVIASNNLILSLKHNDKQMATVILTIDNSDFDVTTRVGHFMTNGEFNELFYEDSLIEDSRGRFIWSVDEYSNILFNECCTLY